MVNTVIYGKDNPERNPDPTVCRFGVGLTTPPCKKTLVTETSTIEKSNNTVNGQEDDSSHTNGGMTSCSEILDREARRIKESLLGPKDKLCFGAWNVRTMYETSKMAQVTNEIQNNNLDILGISECRWLGSGKVTSNSGQTILYSGHKEKHQSGVAIIISKEKIKTLSEWDPISDRLIRALFNSKYCKLTI